MVVREGHLPAEPRRLQPGIQHLELDRPNGENKREQGHDVLRVPQGELRRLLLGKGPRTVEEPMGHRRSSTRATRTYLGGELLQGGDDPRPRQVLTADCGRARGRTDLWGR